MIVTVKHVILQVKSGVISKTWIRQSPDLPLTTAALIYSFLPTLQVNLIATVTVNDDAFYNFRAE